MSAKKNFLVYQNLLFPAYEKKGATHFFPKKRFRVRDLLTYFIENALMTFYYLDSGNMPNINSEFSIFIQDPT